MDKLFVSDEIAIKLKEKGFIEPCMKGVKDGHRFTTCGFGLTNQGNTHDFTLPLHQQVIDWLRNKHGLVLVVHRINIGKGRKFRWLIDNTATNITQASTFNEYGVVTFEDYYEAINKSIEEALNLI